MTRDDVVNRAAEESKDHRGHLLLWLSFGLLLIGACALAAVVFVGFAQNGALDDKIAVLSQQADRNRDVATQLENQVRALGAVPVVTPAQSGPAGATGATGATGAPGQTPPCLLTAGQCQGADGQPGKDGPAGKDGAAGSAGQDGAPGKDGAPGQDGAPGKDGAPGVSVTRQYFDRDADGGCRNFTDFSDGRTRVDEGPAGDAACAPAPPPTTTPSAVLPTGTTLRRRD